MQIEDSCLGLQIYYVSCVSGQGWDLSQSLEQGLESNGECWECGITVQRVLE